MANTTRMAVSAKSAKSARTALPYARRLIGDPYAQEELRNAYAKLREAYGRAAGRPARKAAEDRKLHRSLGEAASSAGRALESLREPPKRGRRRGRRLLLLALLAGGAAAAARQISG